MAEYELSRGVTQICPAGMTLLEDRLTAVCRTAAAHRRENRRWVKPGMALNRWVTWRAPARKGSSAVS